MGESQETIYPAMAMQDMWHAAAASIENAFAAGVDACLMLPSPASSAMSPHCRTAWSPPSHDLLRHRAAGRHHPTLCAASRQRACIQRLSSERRHPGETKMADEASK
jgi:hypothetical protein